MKDLKAVQLANASIPDFIRVNDLAFADYINGPYHLSETDAKELLDCGFYDSRYSCLLEHQNTLIGYITVSIKDKEARVAGMGFIPEARGKGFGRQAIQQLMLTLKKDSFTTLELEVFEQNSPAYELYKRLGFRELRKLLGFRKRLHGASTPSELKTIHIEHAAALCEKFDNLSMPWQGSAWRVRARKDHCLAWTLSDDTIIVTSKPKQGQVHLVTLLVRPELRRRGLGLKTIEALENTFAGSVLHVPQLCPEESAPFFIRLGFEALPLNQIQMRLTL